MSLEGKTVIITGAGTGVGRGFVEGFTKDGAQVFGISRTEADLRLTQEEHGHGRMEYVAGDITNPADVEALVSKAEEKDGKVDILINNAAVYPKVLFLESDIEDWARTIDINVTGMARLCHRVLPGMLERGYGRILNLGSFAWKGPIPTATAYSVSKAAVFALTKALACEVDREKHPDVLINEFLPGIVHTRMTPEGGDNPMSVYEHVRAVVELPANSAHGEAYLKSKLIQKSSGGKRSFLRRVARKLLGR